MSAPPPITLEELVSFLTDCDSDFCPPLSDEVQLRQYAAKLLAHARITEVRRDQHLTGIAAFYCNDLKTRCGFVSCLAVRREARGAKLGALLLDKAAEISKSAGMERLELETNREWLAGYYKRSGFEIIGSRKHPSGVETYRMRLTLI